MHIKVGALSEGWWMNSFHVNGSSGEQRKHLFRSVLSKVRFVQVKSLRQLWENSERCLNTDSQPRSCQWKNPLHHSRIQCRSGPGYGPFSSSVWHPVSRGCKTLSHHHHSDQHLLFTSQWNVKGQHALKENCLHQEKKSYSHIFLPTSLQWQRLHRPASFLPFRVCSVVLRVLIDWSETVKYANQCAWLPQPVLLIKRLSSWSLPHWT